MFPLPLPSLFSLLILQCTILASSLAGIRLRYLVNVPNTLFLCFLNEKFESKDAWILDIWEWPRFWTVLWKDVFVKLSKCETNAFSVSINLSGLSAVKVLSLVFYDVWFHKNIFGFKALAPVLCWLGTNLEHGRHFEFYPKPSLFFNHHLELYDDYD